MSRRLARPLLEDMKSYAEEALLRFGERDNETFAADRLRTLAIARAADIVGEAASRVTLDVRSQLIGIPFTSATAMRNRLIHGYGSVSANIWADTI